MSNKRITDLTELTTPTTDDVFPIVDIATNTTQKVQVGNLPIQTAVTTALATKQDTLVSGTNIKTVNSTSLVGSGNVTVQPTLVSGTNIKTINSTTLLGSGDIAVQPTLVSGTNIKTLNSVSLLGSGDIVLTANPSGVSGAIQFSNGSAFASDAANLFWDDTNNRLGVGTNAPTTALDLNGTLTSLLTLRNGATNFISIQTIGGEPSIRIWNAANTATLNLFGTGTYLNQNKHSFCISDLATERLLIGATTAATIKGSGSTSATTSLLVQDSGGNQTFSVRDDGRIQMGNNTVFGRMYSNLNGAAFPAYSFDGNPQVGMFGISTGNFGLSAGGVEKMRIGTGGIGINTLASNVASATLQIDSTTQGVLFPRMTTTQKNAIATPAAGLVVYDTTTNKLCCYNGSTWNDLF